MDEDTIEVGRLLPLPENHRWRKDAQRPRPLRGGRFIRAGFIRVHDAVDGPWFDIGPRGLEPPALSA